MKRFLGRINREARRARIRTTLQLVVSSLSFSLLFYRMMNLRKKDMTLRERWLAILNGESRIEFQRITGRPRR